MITLQEFLESIQYKITEGSDYGWECFGPNARYLDCLKDDCYSISALFDNQTQTVYSVELWDYINRREYRWQHPDYVESYNQEAQRRNIDPLESLDGSKYIELDVAEDILDKIRCVVAEEAYDTRVKIPVDFSDEELLKYMKIAHEMDITFNELVERALQEAIDEHKRDPEGFVKRAREYINED